MKKEIRTKDITKSLRLESNMIHTYINLALPEHMKPKKSYYKSTGAMAYTFTKQDYKILYQIREMRKENISYRKIKETLERENPIEETFAKESRDPLQHLLDLFSAENNKEEPSAEISITPMHQEKEVDETLINIEDKQGQLLVSSREVAKNFEKEHKHVMESIRELERSVENLTHLFIPNKYKDTYEREQSEYLLTRDGFTLLAMGFTGKKALQWKLKYIEAFNKMEDKLKQVNLPTDLSPELQFMINTERQLKAQGKEIKSIRETMQITPKTDWREWANKTLAKMGEATGDYRKPKTESYNALEKRACCNLGQRLNNLTSRAKSNGVAPSKINNFNFLDVISQDKTLIEIYVTIVKELAIKYGV